MPASRALKEAGGFRKGQALGKGNGVQTSSNSKTPKTKQYMTSKVANSSPNYPKDSSTGAKGNMKIII